jgi:hypothetical protein
MQLYKLRAHLLAFRVSLNGVEAGGETMFYRGKWDSYNQRWPEEVRVKPECGKALFFIHDQLHEGAPVVEGCKYVMRTDVMYRCRMG